MAVARPKRAAASKKAAPKRAAARKSAASKKAAATKRTATPKKAAAPKKVATPKRAATSKRAATPKKVELSKTYKPSAKEKYMSPKQLEYFRQKLLTWRAELLQESENTISHLKEENWQEPDINDRASLETDAALELRTRDRYRKLVNKIDMALSRVADGTYGYCDDTGEEIGLFRLEARPIATLTVEAQEKHERLEKQRRDD